MRWLKRYSFLVMLVITALGYGGGKVKAAVEERLAEIEMEQQLEMEKLAQAQKQEAEKAGGQKPQQGPEGAGGQKSQQEPEEAGGQKPQQGPEGAGGQKPQQEPEGAGGQPQQEKEFRQVGLDYLSDALFIGDSRTSTLYEYAGWTETDFFVKNGLSIWEVWNETMDGTYLEEKLKQRQYGKIYIMLGVNELGNETAELYRQEFESVVTKIRELQPDALIFVQAIIHVTDKKDAEGTYINNQEIDLRNQELKKITDNVSVFWLDANGTLDEPGTGKLNPEYTFDGVHLKVKNLSVWQEFLLNHGV